MVCRLRALPTFRLSKPRDWRKIKVLSGTLEVRLTRRVPRGLLSSINLVFDSWDELRRKAKTARGLSGL